MVLINDCYWLFRVVPQGVFTTMYFDGKVWLLFLLFLLFVGVVVFIISFCVAGTL
jgi:hypothetical protein